MRFAKPELDVGLVCADADAARRFYVDVLGFEDCGDCADADDRTCPAVGWGAQRVFLSDGAELPARRPGGLYAGLGYRVLGLFVFDLEGICERIAAAGRRVADGIDLPGKLQIRFAKDPDGNMLELIGLADPPADVSVIRDRIQVGLTVGDSLRTRAFYATTLALPEQPTTPIDAVTTRHAVTAGSSTLKYWQRPDALPNYAGPPRAAIGIRSVTLHVADLAAEIARIGAPSVRQGPQDGTAWISDPDGNWIALSERR